MLKVAATLALSIATAILATSCRTTQTASEISSSAITQAIDPYQNGHVTHKDTVSISSSHAKFSFEPEHPLNKYIKDERFYPWGLYLFNALRKIDSFSPGESFVESIEIEAKNTFAADSGFGSFPNLSYIYAIDQTKAEGVTHKRKAYLKKIKFGPGYFSKHPVGSNQFQNIKIIIPPHMQNGNIWMAFTRGIQIRSINVNFKKDYKAAAPKLSQEGLNYAKLLTCESNGGGLLGSVTNIAKACLIGPNKPRHVIVKRRFSKTPCHYTESKSGYSIMYSVKRSYEVTFKKGNYYLEVRKGCRAEFGLDMSKTPLPREGKNTGI